MNSLRGLDARSTAVPALAALVLAAALAVATALVGPPTASGARAAAPKREAVVIGLRRRQGNLSAFAQAVSTPGSSTYRDFASVNSLAHRFGAADSSWRRVRRYLRRRGIRNAKLDVTRGFAIARLSRRQRRRAFPPPPRLRRLIGPVLLAPDSGHGGGQAAARPVAPRRTGTPSGCGQGVRSGALTPNQYRTAYGLDPLHARGLFGQGTRIALVEFDGFSQPALNQFARCFGIVAPRPRVHPVGLRRRLEPGDGSETRLDTQILASIAPRAQIDIFQSGTAPSDLVRLFAAPMDTRRSGRRPPDVISSSLGFCEPQFGRPAARLLEYVLAMAAGAGITVVNAAGDSGSGACFTRRRAVVYPASSIFVTSVGGTRLTLTSSNEIASEVVWNDLPFGSPGAGGGGTSRFVRGPAYQRGQVGPSGFRAVPDVALHASGFPGYAIRGGGKWTPVEGTSAAAPLLGGGALLAIQAAAGAGVERPGLLNPLLYQAAGDRSLGLIHDVTLGNNDLFRVGCCSARPGYDRASGWGSLDIEALAGLVVAAGR
jgi:subtilase family serine protease